MTSGIFDTFQAWLAGCLARMARFMAHYADEFPQRLQALMSLAAILLVLGLVEIALSGWSRSSLRILVCKFREQKTDVLSALLYNLGLLSVVGAVMSAGLFYFGVRFFRETFGRPPSVDHGWLTAAIYFLLVDFSSYWVHRFFHRSSALWILHRYHHSAPAMNMINTFRTHPLYDALGSVMMAAPLLLVAPPTEGIVGVALVTRAHTLLQHSNVIATWGWIGRWIFQSPAAHRIHHSTDPRHHDKNFGATLIIWDRLFGTSHLPTLQEARDVRIGVDDDPGNQAPLAYILSIYQEFLWTSFRAVKRLVVHRGR